MALLGSLVKRGLALNQKLSSTPPSPQEAQNQQLRSLLKEAKDTAFGLYHGFAEILESDSPEALFRERIPIHTYESLHEAWWQRQQELPNITWPGKPDFFALSSGTTGSESKRIPVTDAMISSMRNVGLTLVRHLPNYDLPEELFESEVLMLSSSARLQTHENGHREGEISGINVSNFSGYYDLFYRPGKEIASIPEWDDRVEAIAKAALDWNIGAIAGIPSWVLLMLRKVMDVHGLNTIHDIWPNLHVYASGGVPFETFRNEFDAITARPLVIMDTYLASEGFFAHTTRPDSLDMQLALEHGYYYEFVPFDERGMDETGQVKQDAQVLGIHEVEVDQDYVLVISSCSGAWRYVIGDTVKFTQLDPPQLVLTGRTKFFLNAVGSQLSEEKLDAGILAAANEQNMSVEAYSVAAMPQGDGEYEHQWLVVHASSKLDTETFATTLDQALKDRNKNYNVARSKALKGVSVKAVTSDAYLNYLDSKGKKGGQGKTPKVIQSEEMQALLEAFD